MALLNFFKTPRHQRFDYKPRFWNQQKEELQQRIRQIDETNEDGTEGMKARISSSFRRSAYLAEDRIRTAQVRRSNFLLLGVVAALIIFAYVFLSVYLPQIVEALGGNDQM